MPGITNDALGEHRPNRGLATPGSLLQTIKLWYILPALLYSPDGPIKRRQTLAMMESGDLVLLPWL